MNDKQAVFIGIKVAPDANVLSVISDVREAMPEIQAQLPAGLNAKINYDSTDYINNAISEAEQTLVEALVIVMLVVFLFLGARSSVLLTAIALPLLQTGRASGGERG